MKLLDSAKLKVYILILVSLNLVLSITKLIIDKKKKKVKEFEPMFPSTDIDKDPFDEEVHSI